MEIGDENEGKSLLEHRKQPLIQHAPPAVPQKPPKARARKAIKRTLKGTTRLAKHLPFGPVSALQFLSPILTQKGRCPTLAAHLLTIALLVSCAVSCFLVSFLDSFKDEKGKVRFGLATFHGLWVIGGKGKIFDEEAAKYRIRVADFFHGFVYVMVFGAVALYDRNVVECLWPEPSEEVKKVLESLPIWIGAACSFLFVAFPPSRHGLALPRERGRN